VKEAAAVWKVDPSTVRRWIGSGVVSAIRIGKTTLRVDMASLRYETIGALA
jgi:excisionase family DNA binding protein